uniref:Uncharacterized protein n=1 Tax=Oryza punctata TaxID=4537 RepID=A0A0E0LDN4_ORYPU
MSTESTQSSTVSVIISSTSSGSSPSSAATIGESTGAIFFNPYATVNVKTHIPITLELKHPNFNKWRPSSPPCAASYFQGSALGVPMGQGKK